MGRSGKQILGLLLGVGLGALYWYQRQEKETVINQLRADSKVAAGKRGPIEYTLRGTGPAVVVLHGGMGGYEQGQAVADLLGLVGYQVITLSRPGHRQTPLRTGESLAGKASVVRDLLDFLHIDEAVVVALSAGGITALQFGIDYPERCRGLVLVSAHGPSLKDRQPAPGWLWLLNVMMSSDFLVWLVMRFGLGGLVRLMGDYYNDQLFNHLFRDVFPSSDWREGVMNDIEVLVGLRHMPLEAIQAPTLVVHGTGDVIVPYQVALDTLRRVPRAQLRTIERGTHVMVVSRRQEVAAAVARFLVALEAEDSNDNLVIQE
ncbi:MAG TPA: alpha/beta hydrolase [Anaerolineae bacterium]|nr:alpha/beta hydrolase [Anaerolineae bacterium]